MAWEGKFVEEDGGEKEEARHQLFKSHLSECMCAFSGNVKAKKEEKKA